jgi:phage terminase small subunit
VKLLRGVTRKDRLNPAEPQPPAGPIVKPATLSKGASRMWDQWVPICVHMGTMTPADVEPMAMMCELQATLHRAAALKDHPKTFDKAVSLERNHASIIRQYYALFGLDPVSRARIQVKTPEATVSKWAGALK